MMNTSLLPIDLKFRPCKYNSLWRLNLHRPDHTCMQALPSSFVTTFTRNQTLFKLHERRNGEKDILC